MEGHQADAFSSASASSSEIELMGSDYASASSSNLSSPSDPEQPIVEGSVLNRLCLAALTGDLKTAGSIFQEYQGDYMIVNARVIRATNETVLHVAAGANQTEFLEMLINEPNIDLMLRDAKDNTAFFSAIAAGASEIVDKFLHNQRCDNLIRSRGAQDVTPLYMASLFGHGQIASQLTNDDRTSYIDLQRGEQSGIFFNYIRYDLFELATEMLNNGTIASTLANATDEKTGETALHLLSRKQPSAFATKNHGTRGLSNQFPLESTALRLVEKLWKLILEQNQYDSLIIQTIISSPFHLLMEAAEVGNLDFLVVLISCYPALIWEKDKAQQTIFHFAIMNRHVKIFTLIYEIGLPKVLFQCYKDSDQNNILHLVAKKPPQSALSNALGIVLQMRKEILWFQEVEKIVAPSLKHQKNSNSKTPKDVFIEEHMNMMKEAEKWMKKNANVCLIVATIIVTVVFPIAFQDPHDKNSNTLNSNHQSYMNLSLPLLVSNAIAMSFSSIAIVLFLSILTSHFTENELLQSLPCKLIAGFASLFISVTSMLLSYGLQSFIANGSLKISSISSCLQLVPVFLFLYLECPVLHNIIHITFFSKYAFKP